jgi:hypothetical protein
MPLLPHETDNDTHIWFYTKLIDGVAQDVASGRDELWKTLCGQRVHTSLVWTHRNYTLKYVTCEACILLNLSKQAESEKCLI